MAVLAARSVPPVALLGPIYLHCPQPTLAATVLPSILPTSVGVAVARTAGELVGLAPLMAIPMVALVVLQPLEAELLAAAAAVQVLMRWVAAVARQSAAFITTLLALWRLLVAPPSAVTLVRAAAAAAAAVSAGTVAGVSAPSGTKARCKLPPPITRR